jgi:Kef-type K+ transport system membrane component KefB
MVPRGEVGLIVASIGLGLGLDPRLFGVVIAMTVVTTLATPPLLAPLIRKVRTAGRGPEDGHPRSI